MGQIIQQDIAEACRDYDRIFGTNKNVFRTTPSMQDGLKPVTRRFLYSLYMGKGRNQPVKMLKAASDTVADWHPHGGTSVEEAGAGLGNPVQNNITVIDGTGAFGSYKNAQAGASRYIECKLSDYAKKCFFEDWEHSSVDTRLNYTGEKEEPEYLPARYPHALFNPQLSGIGYGLGSNIPPFNMHEVFRATIKLIKNPDAKITLIPDSPTGADIVDTGQWEQINETGVGTLTMKGTAEVDEIENTITITSIPIRTTIDKIMANIVALKKAHKIEGIRDIKDYTKNNTGVKCIIYLEPDVNAYKVLDALYSKDTDLKKTDPVGMTMIDDYTDYDYGVRSFLKEWIAWREDLVRGSYNARWVKLMDEQNINDALIMISNEKNAVKTARMASNSYDKADFANMLIKEYGIDSQKANVIAQMRSYEFGKSYHEKYVATKERLKKEIKEVEDVLDNDEKIDEIIIAQLEEGDKLFGSPRKSKVIQEESKDEIPSTDHVVAISKDGYIKKLPISEKSIGIVGNGHSQCMAIKVNNKDNLMVFTSDGLMTKVPVYDIPDMQFTDEGVVISRFLKTSADVVTVLIEPTKAEIKKRQKKVFVVSLTKCGFVKKVDISFFKKAKGEIIAVKIPDGDALVGVEYAVEDTRKDMIIYTNRGNGIRRDINDFPEMKPMSRGVGQLNLDNEYCVGFDVIDPKKPYIFYITSSGRAKITDTKYLPSMKRKSEVLSLIQLGKQDNLIGIKSVSKSDKVMIYKKLSQPEEIDISTMEVSTRIAKAEKMVKTGKGDYVVSYQLIRG